MQEHPRIPRARQFAGQELIEDDPKARGVPEMGHAAGFAEKSVRIPAAAEGVSAGNFDPHRPAELPVPSFVHAAERPGAHQADQLKLP